MQAEPALRFWLQALAAEGGVIATTDEPALVLTPERWQAAFELADEVSVTADPDVARDDGALFVSAGEPVVEQVAEMVLGDGDAGWGHLGWPGLLPPSQETFQALARDQVIVAGASVEVDGPPSPVYVPVIRVGAMIRYVISLDDRFDERDEVWVDGRCGLPLPRPVCLELGRAAIRNGIGRDHRTLPCEIGRAVGAAHRVLEARATTRGSWLAVGAGAARELELARAEAHYQAALRVIAARRSAAPASGQALYSAQSNAIRAERSRRLLEIGQHPPPSHEIRPFRLHVVGVPALRVPVVLRRRSQSFTLSLDWYLPFSTFGPIACPHCESGEALVLAPDRLGCSRCAPSERIEKPRNGHRVVAAAADRPSVSAPVRPVELLPLELPPVLRPQLQPQPAPSAALVPTPHGLAIEFWEAVAEGLLWPRRATVASSPLEVVTRLYGADGPLIAVGMPRRWRPSRITSTTSELSQFERVTSGLLGADGTSVPYTLRWRLVDERPMVVEVLPFPSFTAESGIPLPPMSTIDPAIASRLTDEAPQPRLPGPVELRLWARITLDGFPFVIRCLVVWRRLGVRARLAGVDPSVLAASVVVVCAERCGMATSAKAEAERFGVSDFAVGHVSRQLTTLVKGMSAPLW